MIRSQAICDLLARLMVATDTDDGVRVSTHVLYPSNSAVQVLVQGGERSFVVSDTGGAVSELSSAGIQTILADRMIRARVKNTGLHVSDGVIISPPMPEHAIAAGIVLVANASRSVAEWGLQHFPYTARRNFKADLAALLARYFHDNLKRDAVVAGKSNKAHRFNHVVYLPKNRKLIVDPVVNDSSSINSRVVANLDVQMAYDPNIEQLIIYDDHLRWKSSDLKLLELGAPTVSFSHAEQEIRRHAA